MVFERSEKKDSTCQSQDEKHHCMLSLFLDAIASTPTYLCEWVGHWVRLWWFQILEICSYCIYRAFTMFTFVFAAWLTIELSKSRTFSLKLSNRSNSDLGQLVTQLDNLCIDHWLFVMIVYLSVCLVTQISLILSEREKEQIQLRPWSDSLSFWSQSSTVPMVNVKYDNNYNLIGYPHSGC